MTCSQRSVSKPWSRAGWLALLGGVLAAGGGCNKSEASTAGKQAAPLQGEGARARVEGENYTVELRPVGAYSKGSEGVFEVVLQTKGDYHINEQYPYKFAPKTAEGVAYKSDKFGREVGQFDNTKAVMRIPFTPGQPGNAQVGGKLSLSVCSDKNCLMEKQDLELSVAVK